MKTIFQKKTGGVAGGTGCTKKVQREKCIIAGEAELQILFMVAFRGRGRSSDWPTRDWTCRKQLFNAYFTTAWKKTRKVQLFVEKCMNNYEI